MTSKSSTSTINVTAHFQKRHPFVIPSTWTMNVTAPSIHCIRHPSLLDHECHSSLGPLAAKRALAWLPKRRRSRLRAPVDVRRTTASRHQERTRTRRTKAQRDSAPLRTAKHSAGLVKQPEKLLLGATQARRSRIDRHRLAASTITSTKSRRLQKTASEVEPSAQSDESTAFR